MGDFSSLSSHTKIRKNTHIYNFIKLTNVLIINNIVKLCNKYLSPKLMHNHSDDSWKTCTDAIRKPWSSVTTIWIRTRPAPVSTMSPVSTQIYSRNERFFLRPLFSPPEFLLPKGRKNFGFFRFLPNYLFLMASSVFCSTSSRGHPSISAPCSMTSRSVRSRWQYPTGAGMPSIGTRITSYLYLILNVMT